MRASQQLPQCPVCGSWAVQCRRPSGHSATEWHAEREDLVALECLCEETCRPWLRRRGKLPAQPAEPYQAVLPL